MLTNFLLKKCGLDSCVGGVDGLYSMSWTHAPPPPLHSVKPHKQNPGLSGGSYSCNTTPFLWALEWGREWGGGGKENSGGGKVMPSAADGCRSPDRFYGHCPPSRPQPPTPRFKLMAAPVWVKGQLDSWSFSMQQGAINRHLLSVLIGLHAFIPTSVERPLTYWYKYAPKLP